MLISILVLAMALGCGSSDEKQFVMTYRDANANEEGRRAWDSTGADDIEYLGALIEEAKHTYSGTPLGRHRRGL